MKTGFLFILTLVLGALAFNYLQQDIGYVLINFRGYAIEMSVPIMVVFLVLAYFFIRFLIRIWLAPRQLGEMAARRRSRKAGELIVRGYIEMGEGNYARGERLLTKGVRNSDTPLLNYLAAARAAQEQGDPQRRDNWLKMAHEQEPRASATVLLTQAELQLASKEIEAARTTLNKVLEQTPRNPQALRLKVELCLAGEDWQELQELLPQLAKGGHVSAEFVDSGYVSTWPALLQAAGDQPDKIKQLWKQLPKHLREHPVLQRARLEALVRQGAVDEVEKIIRKSLQQQWSEELVLLYGTLESKQYSAMLRYVEKWLHARPDDASLLLTAGRLSVRNELWGKARSYFESSIALNPLPVTWHELGQLLTRMGEIDAASAAYQKGLTMSYPGADVPRIGAASLQDD